MMPQLEDRVKHEREQKILGLARQSAQSFREQYSGKVLPVLWEQQRRNGIWSGLTDNYIRVFTRSEENLANKLMPIKLTGTR
jgi:threonylcarbamoyladenosine tRNA methylthiotransferase MtaB